MKKFWYLRMAISLIACNNNSSEKKEETKIEPVTNNNPLLTDEEQKDGWQLLFDGTTIAGWHNYGGGPVGNLWKVEDGTLKYAGAEKKDTTGQDIVTDEEYENFDLKLEWKIDTAGNSGIMFYVQEDTAHPKPILDRARNADTG